MAETISSTISSLINTITLILAAFAGISLVVSSIMIGIITYVSVIERTKEIGIMRSLGARKRDISRIFNAETILIGLSAGLLGVGLTLILMIPINILINNLLSVPNFAYLSFTNGVSLLVLSTALTLVAGLIPSRIAANQDPVIALRTE
jgi:putative ABC transport system permease protein